jgi:formate hydrogenlyase subunit 3/multisubunit Na+/H+ antiporter MnhD subunit
MSGVMIKLGIYGILRMILYINYDYLTMGLIILFISIISGLYGVIMAVIQHNLKKLLAYHSIENIGIIGIGLGIGLIGLGLNNNFLAFMGFTGGLLHIFNHSLFKSLLFYGAGSVYHQTHRINVELLGGLVKKMPQTTFLFLMGSVAICGLPPFNGFISEFLLYAGLFSALPVYDFNFSIIILVSIISLVLIGGIAILCFSKAFGIVFLGVEREPYHDKVEEVKFGMLLPQYLTLAMMTAIGLFPQFFMMFLLEPVSLFIPALKFNRLPWVTNTINLLSLIGFIGIGFLILVLVIYWIRKTVTKGRIISASPTWGCGYEAPNPRMQYTATSYVKTFTSLAKPFLGIRKQETVIEKIFPLETEFKVSSYDKIEESLIKNNLSILNNFLDKFTFLQSGKIQFYILYGLLFILLIMIISFFQSIKLF